MASTGRAVIERVLRGDPGAPAQGRLDNDGDLGQRGDDPVPHREVLSQGLHSVAQLADQQPRAANAFEQRCVSPRVHDVEPGRDDADHDTACVECADVGGGVDADREPADDRDPGVGEHGTDLVGVGQPVRRCGPRPHHRDAWLLQGVGPVTLGEEHGRPTGHVVPDRIAGRALDVDARASSGEERGRAARARHAPASGRRAHRGPAGLRRAARSRNTAIAAPSPMRGEGVDRPAEPFDERARKRRGVISGRQASVPAAAS